MVKNKWLQSNILYPLFPRLVLLCATGITIRLSGHSSFDSRQQGIPKLQGKREKIHEDLGN
jgi:hypothetical protein